MRILSGIQPSGALHLGNYLGMIKPAVDVQDEGTAYIFIANYHALTTVTDADDLRRNTMDMALSVLACGLDPEKSVFFRQSDVPEVTELTWLLSNVTPMGLLERCHSYKDKLAQGIRPNHGLFAYPVLMAADILAYQSNVVPVGRDQKQHVEVARDIAGKFNLQHGEVFTMPEPAIREDVAVVPGVDGRKMSKSYDNTLPLFESKKALRTRVMRIVTDSTPLEEPKSPDGCTVFALYSLFASEAELAEMRGLYEGGGYGYGDAKKALFEKMWAFFEPCRALREELENDPGRVEDILRAGADAARKEAAKTLQAARHAMGLE